MEISTNNVLPAASRTAASPDHADPKILKRSRAHLIPCRVVALLRATTQHRVRYRWCGAAVGEDDHVLWRLMTPRPICNEDGRDVRGRRGGEAEARTMRGVAAGRLLVGLNSCGKNKRY
ncbi:hypothetical protein NDU88_002169 [Pleurodeles waltl]|uniref:Uncharacterized protein n=1 Tax=Pleurodeles waltl TaxID=8319 RepID=A0AAV7KTE8_PLEWA|nr:hypothetical protein NDU88_002169 [Pleurodeles waltl]